MKTQQERWAGARGGEGPPTPRPQTFCTAGALTFARVSMSPAALGSPSAPESPRTPVSNGFPGTAGPGTWSNVEPRSPEEQGGICAGERAVPKLPGALELHTLSILPFLRNIPEKQGNKEPARQAHAWRCPRVPPHFLPRLMPPASVWRTFFF